MRVELLQEDIGGNVSDSLKEEWQEEFVVFECLHISELCQQNVGQHFSFPRLPLLDRDMLKL